MHGRVQRSLHGRVHHTAVPLASRAMKSIYLFAAIFVCSGISAFAGNRGVKTALSIVSAAIAAFALARML